MCVCVCVCVYIHVLVIILFMVIVYTHATIDKHYILLTNMLFQVEHGKVVPKTLQGDALMS